MNHSQNISDILTRAAQAKIAELTEQVIYYKGLVVQDGPFKGMKLPGTASWGNGDILPKILGTYEQELHVSIETCIARKPEVVVNIGCAEGYYAVGLAKRMPGVQVNAYDNDMKALRLCTDAVRLNHAEMVNIGREKFIRSDTWELRDRNSLYVIDCEGAELDYVENPETFVNADLIIECHEFKGKDVLENLIKVLVDHHDIQVIKEGPRDPASIEILRGLNTLERYVALCEMRPAPTMLWMVALAKNRS